MNKFLTNLRERAKAVNWLLLVVLLLLLNVKLVVKLAAIPIILLSRYRGIDWRTLHRQKHLYFYCSVIIITIINFLLSPSFDMPRVLSTGLGIFLWVLCAFAAYYLFRIVQQEDLHKLYNTLSLFFILHFSVVFINLVMIMIECGTLNPYTFKGFHQKYYVSTGDHISGITMDSPVTTALIGAFGVLYFLYRRQLILSLISMAAVVVIASNLTNVMLAGTLIFLFLFKTDAIQKSVIVIHFLVMVVFTGKVSPQNSEYTGRFAYKIMGLTYDKPKKNTSPEFIRKEADSNLSVNDQKKKFALLYIDSISSIRAGYAVNTHPTAQKSLPDKKMLRPPVVQTAAFTFREPEIVREKMNRYASFINRAYPGELRNRLEENIAPAKPGKWLAAKQLLDFFGDHPGKLLLGAGTGNFSSRLAFKTTALGIAGGYPEKYRYIHPYFHNNHLFLYLYYHSQEQPKHAAENTPDSTYGQLVGEYGLLGVAAFFIFFAGYFFRYRRILSFGTGIALLLAGAFFTEYWFEQLSVVVLAEILLFTDIKAGTSRINKS